MSGSTERVKRSGSSRLSGRRSSVLAGHTFARQAQDGRRVVTPPQAIQDAGLRNDVKIIIGGAPVTAEYAQQIGADGYAPDASQAATLAKGFVA